MDPVGLSLPRRWPPFANACFYCTEVAAKTGWVMVFAVCPPRHGCVLFLHQKTGWFTWKNTTSIRKVLFLLFFAYMFIPRPSKGRFFFGRSKFCIQTKNPKNPENCKIHINSQKVGLSKTKTIDLIKTKQKPGNPFHQPAPGASLRLWLAQLGLETQNGNEWEW